MWAVNVAVAVGVAVTVDVAVDVAVAGQSIVFWLLSAAFLRTILFLPVTLHG